MSTGTPKENTHPVRELTIRSTILGGLITLIFTAANAYLELKVGLTFAILIPAAVTSMAVLHYFKNHIVVENNIVQTIASAAGTLSAIIFAIPGSVMVDYWSGFPYWETTAMCMIGGILGVMYSISLRRALVTGSDLSYPESVAAVEVLKVGDQSGSVEENKRGLLVITWGGVASASVSLLAAMRVMAGILTTYFRVGGDAAMVGGSLSLALLGVGHLVGPMVGIAMAVGFFIPYAVLLPIMTPNKLAEGGEIPDIVGAVSSQDVCMIGTGAMAVAAIWTLIKILGPIFRSMKESLVPSRRRASGQTLDLTEQDIPFKHVALITLVSMIPIGFLLWNFLRSSEILRHLWTLIALSIVFVLVLGLLIASICDYMVGLIGASNSPISGVGTLVIIAASLLILLVTGRSKDATEAMHLTTYALFITAIVFGIATISNDNLQDLKTGQPVKATPWRQQVALIIGVVLGSLIIPPVLQLLMASSGFTGMEGVDEDTALQAPQVILSPTIAKGILGRDMKWNLFVVGAIIGVVVVIIDEILGRFTCFHLPSLAVGIGMYLNITITLIIVIDAFVGIYYGRWAQRQADSERSKRLGVLLATDLIVGDSLFGIPNAGIIGGAGSPDALAVIPDGFEDITKIVGLVVFAEITVLSYRWVQAKSRSTVEPVP